MLPSGGFMKNIFILCAFVCFGLSVNSYSADDSFCNGNAMTNTVSVSGNCNGGNCSGYITSQSISVNGLCSNGVSFQAQGMVPGNFINAHCNGMNFSAFTPGSFVQWQGQCSNGTQFSASTTLSGSFINGQCSPNGMFNAWISGGSIPVSGSCGIDSQSNGEN